MPADQYDGTANLGTTLSTYESNPAGSPGSGSDIGGRDNLRAERVNHQGGATATPGTSSDHRPAGVRTFNDGSV